MRGKHHGHAPFGQRPTTTYFSWMNMRNKCNSRNSSRRFYVAEGFCERWDDFNHFLEDVGTRPSSKHFLLRKNQREPYSKENCFWGPKPKAYRVVEEPLYHIWTGMKARCYNPYEKSYQWYGAKGITVCERWLGSYKDFAEDMGPRPNGTSIDRIDGNKGYSKENCRWATPAQQSQNTAPSSKGNKKSKFKGVSRNSGKWAAKIKAGSNTIHLGRFENEIDAALAYNEAAKKHFGEFAWLNKIQ